MNLKKHTNIGSTNVLNDFVELDGNISGLAATTLRTPLRVRLDWTNNCTNENGLIISLRTINDYERIAVIPAGSNSYVVYEIVPFILNAFRVIAYRGIYNSDLLEVTETPVPAK
jgi:hypothetical protein